ncbi:HAD-IG family 5'-nucleotidase [Chondromyces apiculatus]|uniref:HAD superfamily (Subfamily IG) hydrolase, 5'-nucleotidase n=1 Tax=Chondromyces apiculatus DSM 436 TaxID=1192034 RepID=A0A017TG20_9BACT|nr:HAD-IG family 5'-nucleotidase [Chondromyces apiculatus]EYF07872.1 HAD superfamily (Subfamily IG) hydrolase, 5'-nucleotidase [Chondromyces apiculatus DSM 436]
MSATVNPDNLFAPPPRARGIYCNRTLNLRSIKAIGYDMDYTLIHYRVETWERRAFEYLQQHLLRQGWPVGELAFDAELVIRGLILDTQLGNLLKVNRFGYVKRAFHGTRPLDFEEQRQIYNRIIVDLAEPRWVFLNTLFSLSEGCMYAHLVELLDGKKLPGALRYADLYRLMKLQLDAAHMEGALKDEIVSDPDRFVEPDPETPLALLDQKHAGKRLLLITNSEWSYTRAMMRYAFDRFLPEGVTWRDLFDVVIVAARKPDFFSVRSPLFEVVTEEGLLRPSQSGIRPGGFYFGGYAGLVEHHLGLSGDEILYVGDHIYGDVHVSKSLLRWRTALILRELEEEIRAIDGARHDEARLGALMAEKERLERGYARLKLDVQRRRAGYGTVTLPDEELTARMAELRAELSTLDARIAPLARASGEFPNPRWGLLMRAGNDKSHLARQIERSADIYTSRVSNFLLTTPNLLIRSHRGTLPHDPVTEDNAPGRPDEASGPVGDDAASPAREA